MSLLAELLLACAGVLGGIAGSSGAITSLVSYPALLAAGVPALAANIANMVAISVCLPGSALSSRQELAGRSRFVYRWGTLAAIGGLAGAVALLITPSGAFNRVVPFLVLMGAGVLLAQPKLSELAGSKVENNAVLLGVSLFAVSIYNGYFGAGAGVMTLALLLLVVDKHLARANALKNMLCGTATVASALTFVIWSHVDWGAVAPLAVGLFTGAMIGPHIARRLPARLLRWTVAFVGLGLAVRLFLQPA